MTSTAHKAFSTDPTLYAVAVVDTEGVPIGLLNRFKFLEALSRPFGRDLLQNQTVAAVMDATPLIVDEHMPLDQIGSILADDTSKYVFDGFIVTRGGRYLGIGTGYGLIRSLTDRKQAVLFHLAHHDALTGLANRQLFSDRLNQALARRHRGEAHMAVLYIDVDRFKAVNDSLGHAVGDLLLQSIAGRLASNVRGEDTVARLSGDEFAILLLDIFRVEDTEAVASKLLEILREPHLIEGQEINVSCSVGLAIHPIDGRTEPALMRAADAAGYHAKQFRNTWQRFSSDIERAHPATPLAFASIRRAINAGHLDVVYQPQVRAGTRALHGVEALVRWRDPERGLMPTAEFVRLAEDAGMIDEVTDFVLGRAMRQVQAWEREGLVRGLSLAVNVSGVELKSGGLLPVVARHLRDGAFDPSALELEATESNAMLSGEPTTETLARLKALGIRVSIDDFGTGYSSLSRLQRFPVDALKVDRSFVEGIERDDTGALAQAIIIMAHSLGLTVTGEGIETAKQANFLEAHGCDRLQGYFISHPLSAEAMVDFLLRDHVTGDVAVGKRLQKVCSDVTVLPEPRP